MPVFKYKVLDEDKKAITGLVDAPNENIASEILADKGLFILSLQKESESKANNILSFFEKVKPKDLVVFSRQFSVLISANVAIVQSLKILVEQSVNMKLKMVISTIADDVDGGAKLSEALGKYPEYFSNFYTSVIRSGETSGKLDEVLNYLADEMEKDYDMTSKIKGAMIYPAFILTGMSAVGVLMMVYVMPKLTDVMLETNAELPVSTRILIATSHFLINYWWILIMILGGGFFAIKYFLKTEKGRNIYSYIKLHAPVFGNLFQKIYLVRFTRSMHTLIVGGVTIVESLRITAEVVDNATYRKLIEETAKEVEDGSPLSVVFSGSNEIPKMVSQMLSVGEKTGRLDVILDKITDFYGREIDNIVANLMVLMEPIIMVVMGIGVGIMVAAVIMPMYSMANSI
jgi:type II secretory pathway component PulF